MNFLDKLLNHSTKEGDINFELGLSLYEANGVERDIAEALHYFILARDGGNADAMYYIGLCLYTGDGLPADEKKAAYYWKCAAERGNVEAAYQLGCCYNLGVGVPPSHEKAAHYWKIAAKAGNAGALFQLGCYSHDGLVMPENRELALRLWKRAAREKNPDALYRLGVCALIGDSMEPNIDHAISYFEEASGFGHIGAKFELGRLYFEGHSGVIRNGFRGWKLMQDAADANYAQAVEYLAHAKAPDEEDESIILALPEGSGVVEGVEETVFSDEGDEGAGMDDVDETGPDGEIENPDDFAEPENTAVSSDTEDLKQF